MNEDERRYVDALEKKIELLQQENEDLKCKLLAFMNENTPSSKLRKRNTPPPGGVRFPGKPKGSNGGGIQLPEPDVVDEHVLDTCPDCGSKQLVKERTRSQRVLDFPEKPIICTDHQVPEYHCNGCDHTVTAFDINTLNHYGPRLQAIATMLKSQGLSFGKIAAFFNQLGTSSMSASSILSFTTKTSKALAHTRGALFRAAKKAHIGHKDETGFRRDGKNGWVWTLCNPMHTIYIVAHSRSHVVAAQLRNPKQISVTDGYQVYKKDIIRQLCWAHLLRKAERYAEDYPELEDQHLRLKTFYTQLVVWCLDPPDYKRFNEAKWILEDVATVLGSRRHGRKLATYIKNGGTDWLTALRYSGVPLTNNLAERALRSVVVLRKMMGCYRNWKGAKFIENVHSVLTTWQLQGINGFQALTAKLT